MARLAFWRRTPRCARQEFEAERLEMMRAFGAWLGDGADGDSVFDAIHETRAAMVGVIHLLPPKVRDGAR